MESGRECDSCSSSDRQHPEGTGKWKSFTTNKSTDRETVNDNDTSELPEVQERGRRIMQALDEMVGQQKPVLTRKT